MLKVVMKRIQKTKLLILGSVAYLVTILFTLSSTVYAGWSCYEIKQGTQTVGIFDNFWSSSLASNVLFFLIVFLPFCLTIWWFGSAVSRFTKQTKHTWLSYLNLALAGTTFTFLAYIFVSSLVVLTNRAFINPTWIDEDTYGPLSSCSIMTYTLHSEGRIVLATFILIALLFSGLIIARQIANIRKK